MAAIAAARGYRMRAVVPSKIPLEKKVLLKIAGSALDVVNDNVCPSPGMGEGSINLAKTRAKAESDRYAMPNQYENGAQRARPLRDHRPGDLASDRGSGDAPVRIARHLRHGDGGGGAISGAAAGSQADRGAAERRARRSRAPQHFGASRCPSCSTGRWSTI